MGTLWLQCVIGAHIVKSQRQRAFILHICIIETDRPRPELQPVHGTYADMMAAWLGRALPGACFSSVHVEGGDALPDASQIDGVLITGSRHSAYDDFNWIADLKQYLVELRNLKKPVAGICFGHQIMAEAYGGKVETSDQGWLVGRHTHQTTATGILVFSGREEIAALSWHQDQIVRLPEGAEIMLANSLSPYGALTYPFPAMSVQFHPEFQPAYAEDLLNGAAGRKVPEEVVRTAFTTLDEKLDSDVVAIAFADFFNRNNNDRDYPSRQLQSRD